MAEDGCKHSLEVDLIVDGEALSFKIPIKEEGMETWLFEEEILAALPAKGIMTSVAIKATCSVHGDIARGKAHQSKPADLSTRRTGVAKAIVAAYQAMSATPKVRILVTILPPPVSLRDVNLID